MMKRNLLEYFEETVARWPERIAVTQNEQQISFLELSQRAQALGTLLIGRSDAEMNRPIGVFMEKCIEVVISNVAILYSGNAYMNLDVKTPSQRIENILKLVEPALIITNDTWCETIAKVFPAEQILNIDHISLNKIDPCALANRRKMAIDTDPCCLINTSGSTGTPKSVVLNHRSFVDFTEWAMETTGIGENEVIGSLSPIIFDIYSFELCMLMALGSRIVVIPGNLAAFPVKILQLLRQEQVTYIFWVPTIMVNIANMDLLSRLPVPSLRNIWFAGEVFPTKQFNYWKRHFPQARLINLYGPIEITLDCTYFICDRDIPDEEPLPIGYPCRNTDILILTQDDKPAKIGEEGELCVRGTSLALGYYNNPEKTAAAFVQNPLQHAYPEIIYRTGDMVYLNTRGEIMFRGRKDNLIKHQGYRIDLGEIEHVIINVLKLVKNGCVVYASAKKQIVFYYEKAADMTVAQLRKAISAQLPAYMIPSVYKELEELPRNPNGKIDRLKLKEMANAN